jgi:CheY-like chemotaxis protein
MKSVLLVDDDPVCNFIMSKTLQSILPGIEILKALNGQEAMELLLNLEANHLPFPKQIFLDIDMPVMNGFGFLEEMRKQNLEKCCSIAIVSSSNDPGDIAKAHSLGVEEFIEKPIAGEKVARFLNEPG